MPSVYLSNSQARRDLPTPACPLTVTSRARAPVRRVVQHRLHQRELASHARRTRPRARRPAPRL